MGCLFKDMIFNTFFLRYYTLNTVVIHLREKVRTTNREVRLGNARKDSLPF